LQALVDVGEQSVGSPLRLLAMGGLMNLANRCLELSALHQLFRFGELLLGVQVRQIWHLGGPAGKQAHTQQEEQTQVKRGKSMHIKRG
jgi:hypothetical protein